MPKKPKTAQVEETQDGAAQPAFRADLETWSKDRPNWQRHALYLLATNAEIVAADLDALEHCLLKEVGLAEAKEGEAPETLFDAGHLKTAAAQPLRLLKVSDVANVNRLDATGLAFEPNGLTIIYGENGSGKTGFIRVLRKACRTRLEKPVDLEILANIYGGTKGPASAQISISDAGVEAKIAWQDGAATDERLAAFSVFDTRSAQLYVDEGNKLRFLPADLDIPFRLNEVILSVEGRLEPLVREVEGLLLAQTAPFDETSRVTAARTFFGTLNATTTDEAIDKACGFSDDNKLELARLKEALGAQPTRIADLRGKATAARSLSARIKSIEAALDAEHATALKDCWKAKLAAQTAQDAARALISGKDPLGEVGSDVWKELWAAAQEYAAHISGTHVFPSTGPIDKDGNVVCPLCQQDIAPAQGRLKRFDEFMSDKTADALRQADAVLQAQVAGLGKVNCTLSEAETILIENVRGLDAAMPDSVIASFAEASKVREAWTAYLGNGPEPVALAIGTLGEDLINSAVAAETSATAISQAQDATERAKLAAAQDELEDRQRLSGSQPMLKERRNHLKRRDGLKRAQAGCRRNEVTRKANQWVDVHLTKEAKTLFGDEVKRLQLGYLKIELSRQSSSTETGYKNTLSGGSGFKRVSDVLSEGEQRALSLAAFFTEAALERPGGTLIVDDPVSSLDRRRSRAVAEKLVEEAKTRQVIVFTHDLLFLEELGEAAKLAGIEPACQRVFATPTIAGKVDEAGMAWKGQPVEKRVNYLTGKLAQLKKLHETSPTDYEVEAKNLYGRLRDAYERFVEERLFKDVVVRYRDEVRTKMLRYVSLPDVIARRFHEAFTKASLHSHDNPRAKDVAPPDPAEIEADLLAFKKLSEDVVVLQKLNETNRPEMK